MKLRPALILLVLVAVGVGGGLPAYGNDQPPEFVSQGRSWHTAPAPETTIQQGALPFNVSLPLVISPFPSVAIRFGTAIVNNELINPGTVFGYGITALHYQISVPAGQGLAYHEQWTINGIREPQLDASGSIPATPAVLSNAILLSTNSVLPRGSYQVRFLINGQLAGEATAIIQ